VESGNPAFFAGFPSEVEKSAFGLFHGAVFSTAFVAAVSLFMLHAARRSHISVGANWLNRVCSLVVMFRGQRQSFCFRGWNHELVLLFVLRNHLTDQVTHCMTSQNCPRIYPRQRSLRVGSGQQCEDLHLVIEAARTDHRHTQDSAVPAGADAAGGYR
jgi:hypothetical protein